MPLANLGLQFYSLKKGANKLTQLRYGKAAPGEALEIQNPNVEGLDAFDFGKGGEVAGTTGVVEEGIPEAALFDSGGLMAEAIAAEDLSGSYPLIGDAGVSLIDPEAYAATAAAEDAALTGAGEAGGATAWVFSTAVPYIAAAKVGMPIVGSMMEKLSPGRPGGSNVFQQGARLTKNEYFRPSA